MKPGLLSPKGEKELYRAVKASSWEAAKGVADAHPKFRNVALAFAGLFAVNQDDGQARQMLEEVIGAEFEPAGSPFVSKYFSQVGFELGIAPGVRAELPFGRDALGLLLAELYQDEDLAKATETVEGLEPTAHAAVSLAELYTEGGRYDDVIDLTNGIANEDDATALLNVYRGVAFRETGFYEASREAFKEALKSKKRASAIRHLGLMERARTYEAEGKRGMARKDLERILAEDSNYQGVKERLRELAAD